MTKILRRLNLQKGSISLSLIGLGVLFVSAVILPLAGNLASRRTAVPQRATDNCQDPVAGIDCGSGCALGWECVDLGGLTSQCCPASPTNTPVPQLPECPGYLVDMTSCPNDRVIGIGSNYANGNSSQYCCRPEPTSPPPTSVPGRTCGSNGSSCIEPEFCPEERQNGATGCTGGKLCCDPGPTATPTPRMSSDVGICDASCGICGWKEYATGLCHDNEPIPGLGWCCHNACNRTLCQCRAEYGPGADKDGCSGANWGSQCCGNTPTPGHCPGECKADCDNPYSSSYDCGSAFVCCRIPILTPTPVPLGGACTIHEQCGYSTTHNTCTCGKCMNEILNIDECEEIPTCVELLNDVYSYDCKMGLSYNKPEGSRLCCPNRVTNCNTYCSTRLTPTPTLVPCPTEYQCLLENACQNGVLAEAQEYCGAGRVCCSRTTPTPTSYLKPCSSCDYNHDGKVCEDDVRIMGNSGCYNQPASNSGCSMYDVRVDGGVDLSDMTRCGQCASSNCPSPSPTLAASQCRVAGDCPNGAAIIRQEAGLAYLSQVSRDNCGKTYCFIGAGQVIGQCASVQCDIGRCAAETPSYNSNTRVLRYCSTSLSANVEGEKCCEDGMGEGNNCNAVCGGGTQPTQPPQATITPRPDAPTCQIGSSVIVTNTGILDLIYHYDGNGPENSTLGSACFYRQEGGEWVNFSLPNVTNRLGNIEGGRRCTGTITNFDITKKYEVAAGVTVTYADGTRVICNGRTDVNTVPGGCSGCLKTACPICANGLKDDGDANCDGATNLLDLNYWLNQFVSGTIDRARSADFNCDGNINRADYDIIKERL